MTIYIVTYESSVTGKTEKAYFQTFEKALKFAKAVHGEWDVDIAL